METRENERKTAKDRQRELKVIQKRGDKRRGGRGRRRKREGRMEKENNEKERETDIEIERVTE